MLDLHKPPDVTPTNITLASVLLQNPETLEFHLVDRFHAVCPACQRQKAVKRWYHLCSVHSTIARSLIDSDYLPRVRTELQEARDRQGKCLSLVPTLERAEAGRAWLEANREAANYAKGEQRLQEILQTLHPDMRSMRLATMRDLIDFIDRQIAYYQSQIDLVTSWSDRILTLLEETHATPIAH